MAFCFAVMLGESGELLGVVLAGGLDDEVGGADGGGMAGCRQWRRVPEVPR